MSDARAVSPFVGLRLPFDKAATAGLKKAGVSSFQQMWEQVYSKTEQVNRESAVGGTSVSGTGASSRASRGHAVESFSVDAVESEAPSQRVNSGDSEPYPAMEAGAASDQGIGGGGMVPEFTTAAAPAAQAGVPVIGISKGMFTGERSAILSNMPVSVLWDTALSDAAPSASIAPQTADNTAVFRDVLDQIRSLNPQDGQTVVLQLNQGDLGTMQVEVSVDQQRVRADILTSDPTAKEWLEGNQAILHQALARQGFSVERFSVNIGDPEHDFARAERREAVAFLADPLLPYGARRTVLPTGQWPGNG
jgi:hypothetical protein